MQKHCTKYNDNYSIVYWYDNSGNVVGFFYTDKTAAVPVTKAYIYTKNTLGDVTGIVDSTGNIVAKYVYDPWGMVIAVTDGNGNDVSATANHIANINPIRYRGYYLDSETGFYYLQSRYYNPKFCRFINADDADNVLSQFLLLDMNLFVYCQNMPMFDSDKSGRINLKQFKKFIKKKENKKLYNYTKKKLNVYILHSSDFTDSTKKAVQRRMQH